MREPNITVIETEVKDTVRSGYMGEILGVECLTAGKKDHVSFHMSPFGMLFQENSNFHFIHISLLSFYNLVLTSPSTSPP